ncbi:Predicted transcriptional regulator, contains HTH domain [Halobiforma haloterrestris]|uniref:Predicted transcriptional regulator, contains HTH domain n=1 Tax=Natronobacterium haloterrestre TaxID=148448 RepID=A0A1I1EF77_NATHA|nr:ArsR family transcriptional regulator [Halobiforma haloterrestris]SFB85677.1 Predicted transcriptional regulator, contains HTH domain [Halobiforma haloterrestris]
MESTLEEIEFLALSSNRVEVLRLLSEDRYTRTELAHETGASQATLGRILGDFDDRSWITRDGSEYGATATGRLVAEGFADLQGIVETERKLRNVVDYVPTEALTFDIRRLADATITVPTQTRPNAPLQRLLALLRSADEVRAFSHAFNEQGLTTLQQRAAAGETDFRGVFSREAIEALADEPVLRERLRDLLAADSTAVRMRDESIPLAVMIVDDVVYLLLRDEHGVLRASIDTDDPDVRSWAEDRLDGYWADGEPLERDALETT